MVESYDFSNTKKNQASYENAEIFIFRYDFGGFSSHIKDCGKKACGILYKNFKTARQLYNRLMSLDTNDERVEMLSLKARKANKKLEKLEENSNEINIRIGLAKKIAILFCEESYPEIVVESNEEDDLDDI